MAYKILYIEDNPDNMHLIQRVLTARGYEVYGAETGSDGVSMAEKLKPDMILLDINLPDIDGYEVTRRIRNSKAGEKLGKLIEQYRDYDLGIARAEALVVYESQLTPQGPLYTPLGSYRLQEG